MNTVVCIKAVPSANTVRLDPVRHTIIRDGRAAVVNPFDLAALEEALCIKDALGGRVTVLSMGIPDTARLTDDLISRGADEAVLLSDRAFAGADTLATSYALSCAIGKQGDVSLIICGKMAVDGDTAQIGPELAGVLGIPCITDVCRVEEVTEDHITVIKKSDDSTMRVCAALPAVITVSKDIRIPRMPSIASLRAGENTHTRVLTAEQVGADISRTGLNGSPTQVVSTFTPKRSKASEEITGGIREKASGLIAALKSGGII